MSDGFLFQGAEESEEHFPDFFCVSQDGVRGKIPDSGSEKKLGFQFSDRSRCHMKELDEFLSRTSRRAFRDITGDRDGGPSH